MEHRQHRFDQPTKIAPTSQLERAAYRRLFALSSSVEFSVDLALPVIVDNPVIVARLLKFVNSTSRISQRRVTDTRHAITILGARGIREFSQPIVVSLDAGRHNSPPVQKTTSDSLAN